MFQFPRFPSRDYVFTARWRRITGAGFSHSEIRGSKAVQRLTAAYRSRPRPSSAPGAKASTVCPYYLDGELLPRPKARTAQIPVFLALVQFSSFTEAVEPRSSARGPSKLSSDPRRRAGTKPSRRQAARPVDIREMSP